jgi:FtsH-binding integral membrane protein
MRERVIDYLSLPLFLIGCAVSYFSIADNLSPRGDSQPIVIERSILAVIITAGLALFTYYGLIRKINPKKLPRFIYWYSRLSFGAGILFVSLVVVVIIWWHFDPPQWGP